MSFFMFIAGIVSVIIGLISIVVNLIKKNPIKKSGVAVLVGILLMFVGLSTTKSVDDNKIADLPKQEVVDNTKVDVEEVKKEKKKYGLDEWWEVEDQWKLKIDSVSFTDERNQFSEDKPEAVVVIKYSYENLGYEGGIQDLFMTPDNVVDGEKKVAATYPAGSNVSPKTTPIGAIMEGAEESYGLTSDKGEISIYFEQYDDDRTKHKAVFLVLLPNN